MRMTSAWQFRVKLRRDARRSWARRTHLDAHEPACDMSRIDVAKLLTSAGEMVRRESD